MKVVTVVKISDGIALLFKVLEGYGQTETTAASTVQLVGDNTHGTV